MSESSLSVTYDDIKKYGADYLGWTRDSANWAVENRSEILDEQLDRALRLVYQPALPNGVVHRWSFLRPTTEITLWASIVVGADTVTGVYDGEADETVVTATASVFYLSMIGKTLAITGVGDFVVSGYTSGTVLTVAGDATCAAATFAMAADGDYRLPDSCAAIDGNLFHDRNSGYAEMWLKGELDVRRARAQRDSTSRPEIGAVLAILGDGTGGQRFTLMVWPTPDADYLVSYRYRALAERIRAATPYPLGGGTHAELFMQAMLAALEQYKDGVEGPQTGSFNRRLIASVALDRRESSQRYFGYNADRSGGVEYGGGIRHQRPEGIIYG